MSETSSLTRRQFVRGSLAAAAGLACRSDRLIAQQASSSPSKRQQPLKVAVVGAGGRGADNLADLRTTGVSIIALCDCDERRAAPSFQKYPEARRYSDWRKLLEKERDIDAVLVATPDHNHAIISIAAMKLGKHVYCEKPLAHSVWEARRMAEVAAETKVVSQMGTQGHAFEGTRRAVEVLRSGAIGEVRGPTGPKTGGRRESSVRRSSRRYRQAWIGTSGSVPRRGDRFIRRICRLSGAGSGILGPARSGIWASIIWTRPFGAWN